MLLRPRRGGADVESFRLRMEGASLHCERAAGVIFLTHLVLHYIIAAVRWISSTPGRDWEEMRRYSHADRLATTALRTRVCLRDTRYMRMAYNGHLYP